MTMTAGNALAIGAVAAIIVYLAYAMLHPERF